MNDFYVTFGVRYTQHPESDRHPLRMHSKGWAVIEAPDMEAARAIAHEVFGDRYAFIYDHEHFIADGTAARWHHSGELLRIRFDGVQTWADEGRLQ